MSRNGCVALLLFVVAGFLLPTHAELIFPLDLTPELKLTPPSSAEREPRFSLTTSFEGTTYLERNGSPFVAGVLLKEIPASDTAALACFFPTNSSHSQWDSFWHQTTIPINAVPEPTTLGLLSVTALLFGVRRFRRSQ
jgi:hypothetical protein